MTTILLAAGLPPLAQAQTADSSTSEQSIRGVVVNSVTHEPIARALVFSTDQRFAMLTDHEGRFEFKIPATTGSDQSPGGAPANRAPTPGFLLLARKPGFIEDRTNLAAQRFVTAVPDSDYKIELVPEGIISGHVVGSSSETLAGVTVQLLVKQVQEGRARWNPRFTSTANSSGEFRFADLGPGTYKLLTHEFVDPSSNTGPDGPRFGYPPLYYPGVPDFASSGNIHMEPGQTTQVDLSLIRQPYYPIVVPVAGIDRGVPVSISVRDSGGGPSAFGLGYNGREQLIRGSLPNGTYEVTVNTYGAAPTAGSVRITVAGAPFTGPTVTLARYGSIPVSVREEFTHNDNQSGIGAAGGRAGGIVQNGSTNWNRRINLYLQPEDDTPSRGTVGLRQPRGPDDDSLVLENVPPGRYRVAVNSPRGYASAITSGVTDLLRQPLIVGEGGTAAPIEVTLCDDYATVEGEVIDPSTPPGGDAQSSATPNIYGPTSFVAFLPAPDSPGQFAQIPNAGAFKFQHLVPGTYRIIATSASEQIEYRNPDVMRAYENAGPSVTLVGGQSVHVQVHLLSADQQAKERQASQ